MKKHINILVLLFCFSVTNSFAQKFKGGLLLGIDGAQVQGDNMAGFHKPGFVGGGFVKRELNDKWDLDVELFYIQKGSQTSSKQIKADSANPNSQAQGYVYQMKLNYVEMPFMLFYKNKGFIYEAGLSIGALVFARILENYTDESPSNVDSPQSNHFHATDISFNTGLGKKLGDHFFVDWRISTSILPIRPFQFNQTYRFNRGQYNLVMLFTLRYTFKVNDDAAK